MKILTFILSVVLLTASCPASAESDLKLQRVTDRVYAIVGELGNRNAQNLGNNATFGLVVTDAGAVLIDPGGSYAGAAKIDALIRTVTGQPVVTVINTGGQDHRWLGNGYFSERGATIIASDSAVADQQARVRDQFIGLSALVGDAAIAGTEPVYADIRFATSHVFDLGGTRFEIRHPGPAHTPGDSFVWLPQQQTVFSGDIVYLERMPGVGAQSNSKGWIEAFDAIAALQPRNLVPGHGHPADLARARRDSYDYLVFLRAAVGDFIDEGGDPSDIGSIDQSRFDYLLNHESLAGRNALQVYTEMEWE